MSMFCLLRNNPAPSKDEVERALEGKRNKWPVSSIGATLGQMSSQEQPTPKGKRNKWPVIILGATLGQMTPQDVYSETTRHPVRMKLKPLSKVREINYPSDV